jgi:hypothetical protein
MFPLCATCADTINLSSCTHSDAERCITGIWVIGEVCKAVDMGYCAVEVLEFWEYEITRLENGQGLFAGYVDMFLKLKQEASGYPSWVQSEAQKNEYIEDYRRAEGIALDK